MNKRFIEESFPVKEVSEESAKEKNKKHGQISTIHIWWARRPLASSRATNYAALIPVSNDEIDWVKKRNFIIELSKWENFLDQNLINKAREDIIKANNGNPPKILDPFSGGGAIPLEAMRMGCEAYANDYNPVAVLIEKCIIEYPQKYGNINKSNWSENENKLIEDVKKWGMWVSEKTDLEIGKFFGNPENEMLPMAYIWARTIKCQNPSCEVEIPLMKQFWLANKKNNKIALKPSIQNEKIEFEIIGPNEEIPSEFDPSSGTINQSITKCPACGSILEPKNLRKLFSNGHYGEKMVATVLIHPKKRGKKYRISNSNDIALFNKAEEYLKIKRMELLEKWNFEPIPDEFITTPDNVEYKPGNLFYNFIPIVLYGMTRWGDLFNPRQKLTLITIIEKIKEAYDKMIDNGYEIDYAKAITTYLALTLDNFAEKNNNINRWVNNVEAIAGCYRMQALPMAWEYAEGNFLNGAISWNNLLEYKTKPLINWSKTYSGEKVNVSNQSAMNLNYPDNYFDAVFTDPPYYDNVPYSYLSDFFYVWLKRSLGDIYPDLFSTPLTPKGEDILADLPLLRGMKKEKARQILKNIKSDASFELMLKKSFKEIYRVLKPNGIATIVYAHKTTEGWETLINSLLDSNLVITSSWPINTELKTRFRAKSSAALASSIYIVARKFEKLNLGWFKDVKTEIEEYVPQKLDKLWEEGISGADFFIAAIGSAIEIFGKYEKVLDNEGNEIRADKLLSLVRDVVSDYTVRQILHNGIADELSPLTKFYLMWRWNYQDIRVPFDDARKLAQSAGIDLVNEWNKGFIKKRGEFITVLGPDKRDEDLLDNSTELIDVLHHVCLIWKEGKHDEMKSVLKQSGYGEGEALYKVAQAISETLPNNSSEKKMIEGFLAGKDRIIQNMREDESQTKLV